MGKVVKIRQGLRGCVPEVGCIHLAAMGAGCEKHKSIFQATGGPTESGGCLSGTRGFHTTSDHALHSEFL